jgi:hypothetical protein
VVAVSKRSLSLGRRGCGDALSLERSLHVHPQILLVELQNLFSRARRSAPPSTVALPAPERPPPTACSKRPRAHLAAAWGEWAARRGTAARGRRGRRQPRRPDETPAELPSAAPQSVRRGERVLAAGGRAGTARALACRCWKWCRIPETRSWHCCRSRACFSCGRRQASAAPGTGAARRGGWTAARDGTRVHEAWGEGAGGG